MFERIQPSATPSPSSVHDYILERSDGSTEKPCWDFRFTVMGKGDFPFDMLRSDQCHPVDTGSAMNMLKPEARGDRAKLREVTLVSRQIRQHWEPAFDRWKSFGWFVKSTAWEG